MLVNDMEKYIIDFFKGMDLYNEEYFDKIDVIVVDKKYEDIKEFVGFYPDSFKMIVPKIKTIYDVLIWVHEYSHALFPEDDDEIFPNLMEAYFINKYISSNRIKNRIMKKTQNEIKECDDIEYNVAKRIKLSAISQF